MPMGALGSFDPRTTSTPSSMPSRFSPAASEEEELRAEIEHLRQMLLDANEEKHIHVAIAKDEIAERQQEIGELTRENTDLKMKLLEAQDQITQLCWSGTEAKHALERKELQLQGEVKRHKREIDELKRHCFEADAVLKAATAAGRKQEQVKASKENGLPIEQRKEIDNLRQRAEMKLAEQVRSQDAEGVAGDLSESEAVNALESWKQAEAELNAARSQAAEIAASRSELVERHRQETKRQGQQVLTLTQQLQAEVQGQKLLLQGLSEQLVAQDGLVTQQRKEIEKLSRQCAEADASLRHAQHRVEELEALEAKKALREQLDERGREAEMQRAEIKGLADRYTESETCLAAAQERVRALEGEVASGFARLPLARATRTDAQREVTSTRGRLYWGGGKSRTDVDEVASLVRPVFSKLFSPFLAGRSFYVSDLA